MNSPAVFPSSEIGDDTRRRSVRISRRSMRKTGGRFFAGWRSGVRRKTHARCIPRARWSLGGSGRSGLGASNGECLRRFLRRLRRSAWLHGLLRLLRRRTRRLEGSAGLSRRFRRCAGRRRRPGSTGGQHALAMVAVRAGAAHRRARAPSPPGGRGAPGHRARHTSVGSARPPWDRWCRCSARCVAPRDTAP